jgi:hypothetical protein
VLRKALDDRAASCGVSRGRSRYSAKARQSVSSLVRGSRRVGDSWYVSASSPPRADSSDVIQCCDSELEEVDYFALSSDISPYVDALDDNGVVAEVSSPVRADNETGDDTDYFELSSDISPYIEGLNENGDAAGPAPFKVHLLFFFEVTQI